jgi:hypothetical protein
VVYGGFLTATFAILVLITGLMLESLFVCLSVIIVLNGSFLTGSFLGDDSSSIPPSPREPVLTCSKLLLSIYSGRDWETLFCARLFFGLGLKNRELMEAFLEWLEIYDP